MGIQNQCQWRKHNTTTYNTAL